MGLEVVTTITTVHHIHLQALREANAVNLEKIQRPLNHPPHNTVAAQHLNGHHPYPLCCEIASCIVHRNGGIRVFLVPDYRQFHPVVAACPGFTFTALEMEGHRLRRRIEPYLQERHILVGQSRYAETGGRTGRQHHDLHGANTARKQQGSVREANGQDVCVWCSPIAPTIKVVPAIAAL